MNNIAIEKTSFILSKGTGVKCLLFDDTTKTILSNLIPHSKFLDSDFFLFESITSKRTKLEIQCVVVISPSNIKSLIEEITDPCYSSYIVLFTNQVDGLMLEMLARNDFYEVVEEVHEIYLDYYKQESRLYTLNEEGLYSFVVSLKSIPTIYYTEGTSKAAIALNNKLMYSNLNEGGEIYMFHRGFDILTPLLYDWKYQGMIKQFMKYENQIVEDKYVMDDSFFEENKFKDLNVVSEKIKKMISEVDAKKKIKKLNLEEIRELSTLSEMINKHMTIHKEILAEGMKILEISEMEYEIIQNRKPVGLERILGNKEVEEKARAKLLMIYYLKTRDEGIISKFPEFSQYVEKVKRFKIPKYSFDKTVDPKIGYIPPVVKKKKDLDVIKERLNKGRFKIIYFQGGITMREYREIVERNPEVYVVADQIITYKDIM